VVWPAVRTWPCTTQVPWNGLTDGFRGFPHDVDSLRDSWGVTTREKWEEQLTHLLKARNSPPEPETVLTDRIFRYEARMRASRPGLPRAPRAGSVDRCWP